MHQPKAILQVLGLILLLAPSPAMAARSHELRWVAPADSDVAGYRVYLRFPSGRFGAPLDLGLVPYGTGRVASAQITLQYLDQEYVAAMTAYDRTGNESVLSNEIRIAALPPTSPPPATTPDDGGDPGTSGDTCVDGTCPGSTPECSSNADCDDGNTCNGVETCDQQACVTGPAPSEGSSCEDGNPGTTADVCAQGICKGTAVAQRPTPETCRLDLDCDDGNRWNGRERCRGERCVPGRPHRPRTPLLVD